MSSPSEQLFGPRVVLRLAHPHPWFVPEAEFLAQAGAGEQDKDKPLGGQLPPLAHRIPLYQSSSPLQSEGIFHGSSDNMATNNDPFYLRY